MELLYKYKRRGISGSSEKAEVSFIIWFFGGRAGKPISGVSMIRTKDLCERIVYELHNKNPYTSVNRLHCINSLIPLLSILYMITIEGLTVTLNLEIQADQRWADKPIAAGKINTHTKPQCDNKSNSKKCEFSAT